jgi:hypothetical protein
MSPEQARPTGGNAPSPTAAAATATAVPSGPTPPEPITLRIVSLDHYMASPVPGIDVFWSELEGVAVHKVPVVRIFGATPGGQKSCLHLHGVRLYTILIVEFLVFLNVDILLAFQNIDCSFSTKINENCFFQKVNNLVSYFSFIGLSVFLYSVRQRFTPNYLRSYGIRSTSCVIS